MSDFATRRRMMVDTQVRPSDVTKFPIIDALLSVPREEYVPADKREAAYVDGNLDLGGGRVLLEARSFAKLLDAVSIDTDDVVLDLGCGLGYSTAVLARMSAVVVGVEADEDDARTAQTNLSENGVDNAAVMDGDLALGAAEQGPYDVILVNGAIEQVPDALIKQLKEGGRMACIIMEGALGRAMIGHKIDGQISWRFAFNATAPILAGFEREAAFQL